MKKTKLEFRDVSYAYPDGRLAVDGLSVSFREGETVGVVGANGAGKSTLALLALGVLAPRGGEILFDGVAVAAEALPSLRRRIGLCFQNPDDQLFMTTVGEDVAFGPRNLRLPENEVATRVAEVLEAVGMASARERRPHQLSGGEKRAAAVATALAMRPEILIMDEPTASLDPRARRRIMDLLPGFAGTKIVTSHDLDMVMETCERVVVLRDGRVAADGRPERLFADAALLDACGLEPPPGMRSCPQCGYGRQTDERRGAEQGLEKG